MTAERTGTRTTSSAVIFTHSFRLGADQRELPPGVYMIHTHEDVFCGAFDPAYVATSVDFVIEAPGGTSTRIVRPAEIEAALARDLATSRLLESLSENPDSGQADSPSQQPEATPR